MRKKKSKKIVAVAVVEIICLAVLGMVLYRIIDRKVSEKAERKAAEEAAEQEAEEREKRRQELAQWNLLLVNPWNEMPDDLDIETVEIERGYVIDSRVKEDLAQMLADCREAGHSPQIISTFRTREDQQYLYEHTANKADTAFPGTSEHECGLAADIIDADSAGWGDPLIDKQEEMPAQKWLMENCQNYGFILRYPRDKEDITGIIYEPWHYRYVGRKHAEFIMNNEICLEEYLRDEYGAEHVSGTPEEKIGD